MCNNICYTPSLRESNSTAAVMLFGGMCGCARRTTSGEALQRLSLIHSYKTGYFVLWLEREFAVRQSNAFHLPSASDSRVHSLTAPPPWHTYLVRSLVGTCFCVVECLVPHATRSEACWVTSAPHSALMVLLWVSPPRREHPWNERNEREGKGALSAVTLAEKTLPSASPDRVSGLVNTIQEAYFSFYGRGLIHRVRLLQRLYPTHDLGQEGGSPRRLFDAIQHTRTTRTFFHKGETILKCLAVKERPPADADMYLLL